MTWSYVLADLSQMGKDSIRFLLGDTDTNYQQLQDEEIEFALALKADVYSTAAFCAQALAGKYSRLVNTSADGMSQAMGSKASAYATLAREYEAKATIYVIPYAGGTSKADMAAILSNPDRVPNIFRYGMFDNPPTAGIDPETPDGRFELAQFASDEYAIMTTGVFGSELAQGLAIMISENPTPVVVRNQTTLSGSPPYPNPATAQNLVVAGAADIGATVISFSGSLVNGRLVSGDVFELGSDATVYTVTGQALSAANGFAAVAFTPPLNVAATGGETVVFAFLADVMVAALVSSMPARLVNGTTIQSSDRSVRFLATDMTWTPTVTDKVFLFDEQYSVVGVRELVAQGAIYGYALQVRR